MFYLFCLPAFSQEGGARLRIQQLKQQLPLLEGLPKAHCLNQIAYYYIESAYVTSDPGLVYARQALEFAEKINDKKELCIAINLYAKVQLQLSRPDEGLVYYRRLFHLARENGYDSLATLGIRGIGQSLWYQGNFQKAIDTIELSIQYFQRQGDTRSISDAIMVISNIYGDQGNYEKAFVVAQEAFTMSLGLHDTDNIVLSLAQLGELYENIGDYPTAMEYYKKAYGFNPHVGYWSHRHLSNCMGDLYCKLQQYDSAYYFYGQSFIGNRGSKTSRWKTGEYFLARERYDTALLFFRGLYDDLKEGGEGHIFMYAMLGMGNVYLAKKDFAKALYYGNKVLALAREKNARLNIRNACQLLYAVYDASKQPGRALDYYKQYVAMKDSVITDQFKGRLYAFKRNAEDEKKLAQIKLLEKEKTISEQELKENQLLRNILTGGLLFLALLSITIFWNISLKRKNEKLKSDRIQSGLQHRASELEMQALRAQMNPHFIFNCLSSINRFILKNEPDMASDYLTRFSRLIRLVLINSQQSLIVLQDEIEMLRLYIEMEQLRFKNAFDYSVTYTNDIEPANALIPPLLLQPFCENAIWHGLMHKQGHGLIAINFEMRDNVLVCTITDNGIGRAKAAEAKSKSVEKIKSLGLALTTERLALFNRDLAAQTSFDIKDVTDAAGNTAGTQVILKIRYQEFIHETAELKQ